MRNLYFLAVAMMMVNPVLGKSIERNLVAYTADIVHFSPDQTSPLAQFNIQKGQVSVEGNKVTLKLWEVNNCKPGQICLAVMPRYLELAANIVDTGTSCGSIYYHAIDDKTLVDGTRIEITVIDHSSRVCRDIISFKTEVKMQESGWNRMTGDQFTHHHYFGVTKLQMTN